MREDELRRLTSGLITLVIYSALGILLFEQKSDSKEAPRKPLEVSIEVKPAPPPPPPPLPPPPPPVEAPKPAVAEKAPPRVKVPREAVLRELASVAPHATLDKLAQDDAPPLDLGDTTGGTLSLPTAAHGSNIGRVGGTGDLNRQVGAVGAGTGVRGPASVASIKTMPQPIGDYDYSRDYPEEARKLEIEGDVVVRVLVGPDGSVSQTQLVKRLGHGLDEKALELARNLRFKPARDSDDNPVSTWIPFTFHFTLPR